MISRRGVLAGGVALPLVAQAETVDPETVVVQPQTRNLFTITYREPGAIEAPCGPVLGKRIVTFPPITGASLLSAGLAGFFGIPYAVPTVGPLRYTSPRPIPRWAEPRDAKEFGSAPIQTLGGAAAWLYEPTPNQSEDCLTLNVWTPGIRGKRPVMVWLHGGAWRTGRGNAAGTIGTQLAADGDVVVVTVNYRLGALGWLAHPDLADPETGAAANWGMQDQIAALRWVQANIAAFGGDPGRVTLFGQSAGGSSTASIIQDPRNAGLVHRAIIESGSLHGSPGFPEMATAAAYAEALAKRLGVSIRGLRDVPALTLHQAELALGRDPTMVRSLGRPPVLPVLDGVVLKAWPRDGRMAAVPLLIGTTATEGTFWFDLVGPDGQKVPGLKGPGSMAELQSMIVDLAAIYRPEAGAQAAGMAAVYAEAARSRGTPDDPLSLWVAAYTDIVFRLRAREAAERQAAAGQPVYLYEFAHPLAAPAHGVPHTGEIPFVFGTYADPFFAGKVGAGEAERTLSDFCLKAWSRFAHEGEPGAGWAQATATAPKVNVIGGTEAILAVRDVVRGEELAGWGVG